VNSAVALGGGLVRLELTDPRWQDFVRARDDALAFHRPEWAQLLASCYGYEAFALALVGDHGMLAAGLPALEVHAPLRGRRWVALPFTDICPPLAARAGDAGELAHALAGARRRLALRSIDVHGPLAGLEVHRSSDAVLHTLDLDADVDAVFATFHRSQVLRNIRRARREGVTIRRGESASDLTETFYDLHVSTRRRLGVPVQPRRFFVELWNRLLDRELGWLLLAYADQEPVAGAVFLRGTSRVTYKYGASKASAWSLRPNHLLFATAIEQSCQEGFTSFDFGRTDAGDSGLRSFKQGWGTTETALVYSMLAEEAPTPGTGRVHRVGRHILRRSPSWACRAAGELLYRYAA
jgi:CelD/BcsL family acetyltransferase involved in cellulose biosynthesis